MKNYAILFVSLFLVCIELQAQNDSTKLEIDSLGKYFDMSLEELRMIKSRGVSSELENFINSLITVASQKAFSTRESPSAVTLISEEEIKKSGARDLIDVLRMVPGFEFAYDGSNGLGLGVRGNWANEGKVLLQVDGVQLNEIFSGTIQLENRYPISSISRIEIIRGPGSAIFGGFAELGVVNIITKSGTEIDGAYISGVYGQMKDGNARRTINLGVGKKIRDFDLSLTGVIGEGNRSDRAAFVRDMFASSSISTSINGEYQSLADNSSINPFLWNARLGYKGLSMSIIYDNYTTSNLGFTDEYGNRFLSRSANAFSGEIKYDWKISDKITLAPSLSFTRQSPRFHDLPDTINLTQELGRRLKTSLTLEYSPSRKINLIGGFSFFTDRGTNDTDSISTIDGYVSSISYNNYALFTQFTLRNRIANLVMGARYESNSEFGDAFVPRIALTRRMDKFHVKLLYSQSFRSPTIQNIARGLKNISTFESGIEPERSTVEEIEVGYQLTRDALITANFFNTEIKDPIVYSSDVNVYTNLEKSGSLGVELDAHIKKKWGFINVNYSFYSAAHHQRLQIYATREYVPGDTLRATGSEASENVLLALPAHKVTLGSNVALSSGISISPSLIWVSKRYGYDIRSTGSSGYTFYLKEDSPRMTGNVFLNWNNRAKHFEIGAGVYNVFNSKYDYLIPVATRSSSPLPSASREYSIRLSYLFKSN